MTASKILLFSGGLLVAGLILGLVYALRGDGPARVQVPAEAERPTRPPVQTAPVRVAPPGAAPEPIPTPAAAPEPPAAAGQPDAPVSIVRDHRGQGPSAEPSPIVTATLTAVRRALEADLRACAQGVAVPAGDPPRIYLHATFRAAHGKVSARDLSLTGADSLGQSYSDCVGRAVQGLSVDAPPTQPDGEEIVHMPIRLP